MLLGSVLLWARRVIGVSSQINATGADKVAAEVVEAGEVGEVEEAVQMEVGDQVVEKQVTL